MYECKIQATVKKLWYLFWTWINVSVLIFNDLLHSMASVPSIENTPELMLIK